MARGSGIDPASLEQQGKSGAGVPQARAASSFASGPRNPAESALNPCGDAFKIGRAATGVCQCSFWFARRVSGFSAFGIRDVLDYWRRF